MGLQSVLFFKLECGVRQERDLSPYVLNSGCYVNRACLSIQLHADDILLLTPSVESLQKLVTIYAT